MNEQEKLIEIVTNMKTLNNTMKEIATSFGTIDKLVELRQYDELIQEFEESIHLTAEINHEELKDMFRRLVKVDDSICMNITHIGVRYNMCEIDKMALLIGDFGRIAKKVS